jgi:hypothetical protein
MATVSLWVNDPKITAADARLLVRDHLSKRLKDETSMMRMKSDQEEPKLKAVNPSKSN